MGDIAQIVVGTVCMATGYLAFKTAGLVWTVQRMYRYLAVNGGWHTATAVAEAINADSTVVEDFLDIGVAEGVFEARVQALPPQALQAIEEGQQALAEMFKDRVSVVVSMPTEYRCARSRGSRRRTPGKPAFDFTPTPTPT